MGHNDIPDKIRLYVLRAGRPAVVMMLVMLVMLPACSGRGRERRLLSEAERVVEENPDSALRLLDSVSPEELEGRADKALYGLLVTQARLKLRQFPPSDSLIVQAMEYYSDTDDRFRHMRALLYGGMLLHDRGRFNEAAPHVTKATELAAELEDTLYEARAEELAGSIHFRNHNYTEARIHFEKSRAAYEKCARIDNALHVACDIGRMTANEGDYARGMEILDSVRTIALRAPRNDRLLFNADHSRLRLFVRSARYPEAVRTLREMDSTGIRLPHTSESLTLRASLMLRTGRRATADSLLREAEGLACTLADTAVILLLRENMLVADGDEHGARTIADTLVTLTDREARAHLKESLVVAQRNAYAAEASRQSLENSAMRKERTMLWIIIGVATTAAVVVTLLIGRMRRLEHRRLMDRIMLLEAEAALAKVNEAKNPIPRNPVSEGRAAVYRKFMEPFQEVWDMITAAGDDAVKEKEAVDRMKSLFVRLRGREGEASLRKAVNENMEGLADRLARECPFLKDSDYRFMLMALAGIPPKMISTIYGLKLNSYYRKKRRLIERVREEGGPEAMLLVGDVE